MTIKYDKDFVRGLFSQEESNHYLFINPIAFFCWASVICICSTLIPFKENEALMLTMLTGFFSALTGLFIVQQVVLYLYKHLLRNNPFKDDENEEKKLIALLLAPIMNALACICLMPMVMGNLGSGEVITYLDRLGYFGCALVIFTVVQSFVKFHVLEQIERIKLKSAANELPVDTI